MKHTSTLPLQFSSAQLRFNVCRFEQYFLWHPGFYFRRFDSGWVRICKKTVLYNVEYMLRALTLENTLCRRQYIQWIFYMCSICKVILSSINEWCLINNNLDFFLKNLKRLCCVFTIHFLFICCFLDWNVPVLGSQVSGLSSSWPSITCCNKIHSQLHSRAFPSL